MLTNNTDNQIQNIKKQIEDLKHRKKLQANEIDSKINQLQDQILNCQKIQINSLNKMKKSE